MLITSDRIFSQEYKERGKCIDPQLGDQLDYSQCHVNHKVSLDTGDNGAVEMAVNLPTHNIY